MAETNHTVPTNCLMSNGISTRCGQYSFFPKWPKKFQSIFKRVMNRGDTVSKTQEILTVAGVFRPFRNTSAIGVRILCKICSILPQFGRESFVFGRWLVSGDTSLNKIAKNEVHFSRVLCCWRVGGLLVEIVCISTFLTDRCLMVDSFKCLLTNDHISV